MEQNPPLSAAAPVRTSERIASIDVLRGFALLGILVMNIQSFAMIEAAYFNPNAFEDLTDLNYVVWLVGHLLADQKMMAIFSMLFGAGMVLMAERAIATDGKPAGRHYLRMTWLLLFGLAHAYLLWFGDILYTYALCGMILFPLRRLRPAWAIGIGVTLLAIGSGISILFGTSMPSWPPESVAEIRQDWAPNGEQIAAELAVYRGGWLGQLGPRAEVASFLQTFVFATMFFWRAGGCMLIGMGCFKLGVFGPTSHKAKRSQRLYATLALVGFAVGLAIVGFGIHQHVAAGWAMEYSFFQGMQFNYWGSLFVAFGWIGLVMWVCFGGHLPALQARLAAVGRMALTNYLLQTVIGTTLFYGHGFAQFGHFSRTEQALTVLAIWIAQLVWSSWWLARFRFGPFEWLWRCLTYGRLQPFRRRNP